MANRHMSTMITMGKNPGEDASEEFALVASRVIDLAIIKLLDEVRVIDPDRGELLVRLAVLSFQRSGDAFRAYGQFTHRALCHLLLKLTVGDGLHFGRKEVLLQQHDEKDAHQEIPDAETGLREQGICLALAAPSPERRIEFCPLYSPQVVFSLQAAHLSPSQVNTTMQNLMMMAQEGVLEPYSRSRAW